MLRYTAEIKVSFSANGSPISTPRESGVNILVDDDEIVVALPNPPAMRPRIRTQTYTQPRHSLAGYDYEVPSSSGASGGVRNRQAPAEPNNFMVEEPDHNGLDEMLTDLAAHISDDEVEEVFEIISDNEANEPDNPLIYPLMEMFPQACPNYIRQICRGKTNGQGVLDGLITQILETNYPQRKKIASPEHKMDAEQQLDMLKQVLPDADPNFLNILCEQMIDQPEQLKIYISELVETRAYPTMTDYLRKQQVSAQQKQYTTDFSVQKFLEVIPDPFAYFEDPQRKPTNVQNYSNTDYALISLRNQYCRISVRTIREIFAENSCDYIRTCKVLDEIKGPRQMMKTTRAETRMPELIQNIPLLQEIAFIKHRAEIKNFLVLQKIEEEKERKAARTAGLLQTCSCCFDDEVMPKDIYNCEYGCVFCKDCVRKGAEVAFGDGKLDFACLNSCESHFSLQTLQAVLKPKMFSVVALKKQVEEVKAAGIEDLETCPFCDFVTIPARDDKLFHCLNPDCMKESCRLCKEPSHVPLRCAEVEKENDVKIRTYIENKMTEALLRKCYKCGLKFIKADGCNKMTCSCGAFMCYVCNQPVKDYKHFNGPGGDNFNLCPLYSDTNEMHKEAVLKGAAQAKQEMGADADPTKLKIDPTADVNQHYEEVARKNPVAVPLYEVVIVRQMDHLRGPVAAAPARVAAPGEAARGAAAIIVRAALRNHRHQHPQQVVVHGQNQNQR